MAAGQAAFSVAADDAALDACTDELAVLETDRGALHARQLRVVLRMHAVGGTAGMELSTVPRAALAMGGSEHRAAQLLTDALGLGELPGGLEALECGLLTVEQSSTVVRQLAPLPFPARLHVWSRVQQRLVLEADRGSVLPPARLTALLARWVVEADPTDAAERRRRAEDDRRVDWRRRDDGLNDLFAFGFTGPDLQAALSRVRDRAHPVGPDDERTAEQRRFDAFKDLLLGRDPLPLDEPHDPTSPCACSAAPVGGGRAGCGCLPGAPVPCGAELLVHLTIDTGLGTGDSPAELVGHGPLEPDMLQALLLAAPRLRPVWTDEHGAVVAVGDRVVVPARADAASVRDALLQLAALPPPLLLHPRSPHDHPLEPPPERSAVRLRDSAPLATAHPPGPYRASRRLRRLIQTRAPRCEWPGCGARAVRCDAEHDVAWPDGPTCACNLGPCCRRHHRVKQLGWTKTRSAHGVTWTGPGGGRSWLSPAQHEAPAAATRAVPPLIADDPLVELNPLEAEEELWWLAGCPDDLAGLELRSVDRASSYDETDHLRALLRTGDSRWLELDDPYGWNDAVPV